MADAASSSNFSPADTAGPSPVGFVGRRSRLVVARIVLPMLALGLAITLVILPSLRETEPSFMLSFSNIDDYDDTLRMVSPRYVGTDSKNHPFVIAADSAVRDRGDAKTIHMQGLDTDITLADGTWVALKGKSGIYSIAKQTVDVAGGASVFSDLGYEIHADNAHIDLGSGEASGRDGVRGQGPVGSFTAGGFHFDADSRNFELTGGVRMTIRHAPASDKDK